MWITQKLEFQQKIPVRQKNIGLEFFVETFKGQRR